MQDSFASFVKGAVLFGAAAILAACNGGGGGGSSGNSGDTVAPTVALVSPTYKMATTNNGVEVEVRAEDNVEVSAVTINDIEAEQLGSQDIWTAVIPITTTVSSINVEASDSSGNETTESFSSQLRKVDEWESDINDMSLVGGDQLVLTDSSNNNLLTLSLNNLALGSETLSSASADEVQLESKPQTQAASSSSDMLAVGQEIQSRSQVKAILNINTNTGNTEVEIDLSGLGSNQVVDFVTVSSVTHLLTTPQFARSGASIFEYNSSDDTLTEIVPVDPIFENPREMVRVGSNLYIVDNDRLILVNLSNNQTSILSDTGQDGVSLNQLTDIAGDAQRNLLWATTQSTNGLIKVNLASGNRTLVSNASQGEGPLFALVDQVLAPAGESRIFVSDSVLNMVFAVDPDSGDRQYLMSNRLGFGPRLASPDSVAINPDGTHVAIADSDNQQVYEVELSTGNRRTLLDNSSLNPYRGTTWQGGSFVWTINTNSQALISIDKDTGLGTTLGTTLPPDLASIERPTDIFFSNATNQLVIPDIIRDTIYAVDASTGETVALARNQATGTGAPISKPIAIAENTDSRKVYVLDSLTKSVIEIDIDSEQSRVIAGSSNGSGINFSQPTGLAVSADRNRGYVSDTLSNQIIAFNLDNGNRALVAGPTLGSGEVLQSISALSFDASQDRIIATDQLSGSIYAIDPDSGDRSLISR